LFFQLHGATRAVEHDVLLIMGMNTPGAFWHRTVRALTALPGVRVCTFDHRGVGQSTRNAAGCTIASLARDAQELLVHLEWKKAHVVAVSMGGMVAQRLVLQDPGQIRSLTLMSTTARRRRHWLNALRILRRCRVRGPFDLTNAHNWLVELHPWSWLQARHDAQRTNYDYLLHFYTTAMAAPRDRLARPHFRAMQGHRLSDRELAAIASLPISILVLHGEADLVIPVEEGRQLAEWTHGRLVTFPGGGHLLIDQFTSRVDELLRDHILGGS
jgi:pimeloyl-ACP methyl ester carboxylesterase